MPGKNIKADITQQSSAQTHKKYFFLIENKWRQAHGSRITLTSPDPSAVSTHKRTKRDTAESDTPVVTFVPFDDDDTSEGDAKTERKIADEL
jgi:hypothetical protein